MLARAEDGVARAFVNVCRHRGAPVCAPGQGTLGSQKIAHAPSEQTSPAGHSAEL